MAATRSAEGLRSTISGAVIAPGDPGYDTARSLWNGTFDRRPAVIVCCSSPADVAAAIGFAEANGLEISVRGGGHSFSGASAGDDGLMIHLGAMSGVIRPLGEILADNAVGSDGQCCCTAAQLALSPKLWQVPVAPR